MEEDFIKACYDVSKSKNTLHDAWSGDHLSFYSSLGAVDRTETAGTRSYAATGYLKPNLGRPNLKVLTSALVSKVLLETDGQGEPKGINSLEMYLITLLTLFSPSDWCRVHRVQPSLQSQCHPRSDPLRGSRADASSP
jgi:hypothetical protein